MAIYHFSRTRVSETRVPHQFCHHGTAQVEIGDYLISKVLKLTKLEYLVIFFFWDYWQININKKCVYLISKVLELNKLEYLVNFFFWDYWHININKKCVYLISKVLELTKLEYFVIYYFFFWDYWQININIKISRFFMFLFI